MDEILSAALALAGATLGFLFLAFLVLSWRRNAAMPKAPKTASAPRPSRAFKLPNRNRIIEPPIEMAPERLARIRARPALDMPVETASEADGNLFAAAPAPPSETDRAELSQTLDTMVAEVEQAEVDPVAVEAPHEAKPADRHAIEPIIVRLTPQIPPRDIDQPTSWFGGRPRLERGANWPEIREVPAIFLAQISFADLPRDLWDGLGPRTGAFAVFTHPHDGDTAIVAVADPGEPINPPRPQDDADHWFTPRGALHFGDLKPFVRSGIPAWPVDLIAVRPGDPDPRGAETAEETPGDRLDRAGYDIADPAFHPFDWDLMAALAEILAMRIERFWREVDGPSPIAVQAANVERRIAALDAGGDDPVDREELENMRVSLGDLAEATEDAAVMNRDARVRAEEIVAIIRDSAHKATFSPGDAAAVMGALRAIRWTKVHRGTDPDGRPGAERIESQTLPLTEHHPDAPLWVHDYQSIWFDHARRAYAANPNALSDAARAVAEPWFHELAARAASRIGNVAAANPETHATLLELPSSQLMGWVFGDAERFTLALRKADLAMGRFDRPAVQPGN